MTSPAVSTDPVRLHVVHTTAFTYPEPATVSYNEARMLPRSSAAQQVVSTTLTIEPLTWSTVYTDYWGTQVTAFEVLVAHQSLRIVAEHLVDVRPPRTVPPSASWDVVRSAANFDRFAEFLVDTPVTAPPDEVVAVAAQASAGRTPADAAEAVCEAVRAQMSYIPGVTTVHTPASEAWAARAGVCQDIAHLAVGALRSVGIPARYVSGYLHPAHDDDIGRTVTGQSHAWVEWWSGGWTSYDPTNCAPVGAHHVRLARGRYYDDVAPLRGIYAGGGVADLNVEVQITRQS
ncbi:MAG: transglutaminase family protein [Micrococcales bacterium]|nr:transglutaminase family protein [Micrococcales bacterium]MCL2666411.1 transglutaminase family protein [Micrococcales bacterium]